MLRNEYNTLKNQRGQFPLSEMERKKKKLIVKKAILTGVLDFYKWLKLDRQLGEKTWAIKL